ncbi:MAG: inositol monophosphatase family protein [Caldilineaceae bacterium]
MVDQPQDWLSFAADIAVDIAVEAGEIEKRYFRRSHARRKADGTLITEADEQANAFIVAQLRRQFPDHAILSEEGDTVYDPSKQYTWVVDPLDGTTNFARGLVIWGVSIGLLADGAPVLGVLHFPLLHETYRAIAGGTAFCNDELLELDAETVIDNQQILTLCTRSRRRFHIDTPLKTRMLGSAAYHLLTVATGAALAGIESTPKVWDLAAAYVVLTAAGGVAAHTDGTPIFPLSPVHEDYVAKSKPVLAAGSQRLFEQLQQNIQPISG